MLLQANGRLKVYSLIAFIAFSVLVMELPIVDTGTCLGILVIVCVAVWIELSDYFEDEDLEEDE